VTSTRNKCTLLQWRCVSENTVHPGL